MSDTFIVPGPSAAGADLVQQVDLSDSAVLDDPEGHAGGAFQARALGAAGYVREGVGRVINMNGPLSGYVLGIDGTRGKECV